MIAHIDRPRRVPRLGIGVEFAIDAFGPSYALEGVIEIEDVVAVPVRAVELDPPAYAR